jgi:2-C-methyl-D-erythritol 2,4-cyclodiphosphate synthase
MGEGDLGRHFPSTDPAWRGVASREILARVAAMLAAAGFAVGNVDATIVAHAPRLGPHREKMAGAMADVLGVAADRVNVKVTSTDELGFIGREEGIAALAVALIVESGESA